MSDLQNDKHMAPHVDKGKSCSTWCQNNQTHIEKLCLIIGVALEYTCYLKNMNTQIISFNDFSLSLKLHYNISLNAKIHKPKLPFMPQLSYPTRFSN